MLATLGVIAGDSGRADRERAIDRERDSESLHRVDTDTRKLAKRPRPSEQESKSNVCCFCRSHALTLSSSRAPKSTRCKKRNSFTHDRRRERGRRHENDDDDVATLRAASAAAAEAAAASVAN